MVQALTVQQVKLQHPAIYEVFFASPVTDKKPGESLHTYLKRKGIKCFCPNCRAAEKQQKMV